MIKHWLKRSWARMQRPPLGGSDAFLNHCSGVVHVGANTGQERELYRRQGLRVIWLEPIPEVYAQLVCNLAHYPDQRAVEALITEQDGEQVVLHVANNGGASSSLLDLAKHKEIWPEVDFVKDLPMNGRSLPTVLAREGVDLRHYDALVLDTQGTELRILRGALPVLQGFTHVRAEAPDHEAYKGCCTVDELAAFMNGQGYKETARTAFAAHPDGGRYFDVVFSKQ